MSRPHRSSRIAPPASRTALLAGSVLLSLVAGCASFPDQPPAQNWHPQPRLTAPAEPQPQVPGGGVPGGNGNNPGQAPTAVPPPNGCKDFHPIVIATCQNPISAVAGIPGGDPAKPSAFAADRTSGKVLRVQKDTDPTTVATLQVDASGDGGVLGLALSPSYAEDQLLFAYVTTATDNRVVRIAPGDTPKPVLTGIPKGATGNRGTLATDRSGALLLATGDAGTPSAADDPRSLAGKLLRIDTGGKPAKGNPTADSPIVASGLHAPGGVCSNQDGSVTWLTDQTGQRDVLYKVKSGSPLGQPAWTWPDRPGVAGCAAFTSMVWVATSRTAGAQALALNKDGSFQGKPAQVLNDNDKTGFGLLGPVDLLDGTHAVVGTVNKAGGGQPVSSDDRVFVIDANSVGGPPGD